jgi:hypothetical protein
MPARQNCVQAGVVDRQTSCVVNVPIPHKRGAVTSTTQLGHHWCQHTPVLMPDVQTHLPARESAVGMNGPELYLPGNSW